MLELIGVLETAPELVAELSLGIYTPVLPITTATVGQVIVVKATDENGRPTKFEAVDIDNVMKQVFVVRDEGESENYLDT